jgi:DNA invertase Pin-like site-specific DNA recombinase
LYCRVGGRGELLVTVLAGFATFERHLIKVRTDEGRKRAKARGVRFGQPRKLDRTSVRKRCSVSPMAKHWST